MSLTSNRVERFRCELLSKTEQSLGFLDGVESGSVAWNANATLPAGGHVLLQDLGQAINVSNNRIRLWWVVDGYGEWPLGVYVLAAPARQYVAGGSSRDITLIDKLTVIKDDCLTSTLQFAVGANIVNSVISVIQSTGETKITSTASAATLSTAMAWEPGTSKLTVINDLLNAAGYWGLWTDRYGQFRIEPYVKPADRPIAYTFEEGATSIHLPTWTYELPLWDATNKVVLVSQANSSGVVMVATATDTNHDSPTSTVSMGRILNPIIEENVQASSQADLQAQADRKLIDNSNTVGKLAVSHAPVPVWYNEAVRFKSQGTDTKATIIEMSLELMAGSLVQAKWRQS